MILEESARKNIPPVYGLILAGGKSKRMGQDKAKLEYCGKSQVERCYDLLVNRCDKTFISSRKEQFEENLIAEIPAIHDTVFDCGPLSGIVSAMQQYQEVAWLVIACDLPFLDELTLEKLINQRNHELMATCYQNQAGLPEPMCAIYEPEIRLKLLAEIENQCFCPRKILKKLAVQQLKLENSSALDNINFFHEYQTAKDQLVGQS